MKIVLMVLAALLLIGSIVFSVMVKQFLDETLSSIETKKEEIVVANNELSRLEGITKEETVKEKNARSARNEIEAKRDLAIEKRDAEVNKVVAIKKNIETLDANIRSLNAKVRLIFPTGDIMTPDEIQAVLDGEKQVLAQRKDRQNELADALAKLESEQLFEQGRVRSEEGEQFERKRKIILGTLESVIVGANDRWGFFIINAGKDLGVEPDSKLLVRRAGTTIATLRITTLRDKVSVCEVMKDSLLDRETMVRVGDKVIFVDPFRP